MGRFANSKALAGASWNVLKADKELAVLPVLSFVATIPVVALFGGGIYVSMDRTTTAATSELSPTPLTYVIGAVGYLLLTFVVFFFTAALVSGALERFRGGNPSVGSALGGAGKRIGPIFAWAMLAGTVGLLLQALEERLGVLGQIAVRLVGMAWQIVTWLAIPVIVDQGTGPFASLRESASLFRRTWGENLISQAGLGIIALLVMLPGLLIGGAVAVALPFVGIPLIVVWAVVVSIVFTALNGILRTAIYLFATGQEVPGFSHATLQGTFRLKS